MDKVMSAYQARQEPDLVVIQPGLALSLLETTPRCAICCPRSRRGRQYWSGGPVAGVVSDLLRAAQRPAGQQPVPAAALPPGPDRDPGPVVLARAHSGIGPSFVSSWIKAVSAAQGYRTSRPVRARPIIRRWISEVPSKMVKIVDVRPVYAGRWRDAGTEPAPMQHGDSSGFCACWRTRRWHDRYDRA